jgi:ABC-type nitrate/sulfonate/bicarbonate transport system permease component
VVGVLVGEILGSRAGLGTLINHAYGLMRTADYVALVVLALENVMALDGAGSALERRAQRWSG